MRWLGLDWDGDAVFQFARADRHAEVAHAMVDERPRLSLLHDRRRDRRDARRGAGREAAAAHPQPVARPRPDDDARRRCPSSSACKAPREGATTIEDRVQGSVTVQNAELDDLVLLRSDGTPTYMLAVVVDDHDMGVTHVIRGDDHLNNAFRQLPIYRAMELGPSRSTRTSR